MALSDEQEFGKLQGCLQKEQEATAIAKGSGFDLGFGIAFYPADGSSAHVLFQKASRDLDLDNGAAAA